MVEDFLLFLHSIFRLCSLGKFLLPGPLVFPLPVASALKLLGGEPKRSSYDRDKHFQPSCFYLSPWNTCAQPPREKWFDSKNHVQWVLYCPSDYGGIPTFSQIWTFPLFSSFELLQSLEFFFFFFRKFLLQILHWNAFILNI